MILATDVYYFNNQAKAVGVTFESYETNTISGISSAIIDNVEDYEPGSFYKRELPCIIELFLKIDLSRINAIIIDGYVFLDDNRKEGLGAYLYHHLKEKVPVIGVAKTSFHDNKKNVFEVFRGKSKKPLFVTSIGIDLDVASLNIKSMYGENRFPDLLKLLDQETKNIIKPQD